MLTPPDTTELQFHMRQSQAFTAQESLYAEDALQRATDLMEVATGIHEDPEDELAFRIMTTGILAMAHYILVSGEDRESAYSPFSSERLGSYSYSKFAQSVQERVSTGVPEFDQAIKYFQGVDQAAGGATAAIGLTSEHVWKQPYTESDEVEKLRDPQVPLSEGAWSK